ncbi:glycoside hydrolase [Sediminicola sp. YIK13]|uniref:glycoside hydrolase family 3 protein n=1 Tax=Sediminicola sp. YIK13 TaxID=1453352 RepID=UPI0007207256|nr:glycoside hydrolase family 3 N-terminal domain-containing protein [Sediminicola sp. YIK13]ALM07489.1 glycoside hydrolase [Sediminicola sp. YIK13]
MTRPVPYPQASAELSLKEKVGQLFMPAAFINDSESEIQALEKLIKEHHIGSLCFFHSRASAATNFEGKKEVVYNEDSLETLKKLIVRYQKAAKTPLLMSIDAEWGLAMRVEQAPQYPYAITQGALEEHTELIFKIGKNIAHDCKYCGIHWNLAPVVDINNNPNNPVIGYRSYGESKELVSEKAIAYTLGTKSEGVLTCAKHFPGHGDTAIDSHLGLPIIEKSKEALWENELFPFRELIENGVDSVMIGHLSVPSLSNGKNTPATLSKEIIKGVLRKELQFNGVVISDALNMHSVSKMYPTKGELEWVAFDAGNDVLCFAENIKEGMDLILKNASKQQIEESFERFWNLKLKAFNALKESPDEARNPVSLNHKLAYESLSLVHGDQKNINPFRKEGFVGVTIGKEADNPFFGTISKSVTFAGFSTKSSSKKEILEQIEGKNVLLTLFPPLVKPKDNFGVSQQDLALISEILANQNVVLYHFGNPYFLNLLPFQKARAVVVAFQDFETFQQNAANHFLGKVDAKGKLPITLNSEVCTSTK